MERQLPRLVSASFGLAAFAVAIVAGLVAGNSAEAILVRAIVALACAAVAGFAIGLVCGHLVRVEMRKIDAAAQMELGADLAAEMESSAAMSAESLESARRETDAGESVAGGGAVSTGRPRT
jgi:predicted lipid-binding transport protein (Tim44 family)